MHVSRNLGHHWENIALSWLKRHRVQIIERNFRCRAGEIDVVARDGTDIAFIEVKFRANARHGLGHEHVTATKRQRIARAAQRYLQYHSFPATQVFRFDVISIDRGTRRTRIKWIKNAFWAG